MAVATADMNRRQDGYAWRLLATALSFMLFGLVGLSLRLVVFPLLGCLPGSAASRRQRARRTIGGLFWRFVRIMRGLGVLTYEVQGAERLGRPGQMIIANHPSLIDVVFLLGLVPHANCVVKQSLFANPFTRGPVSTAQYIGNDGSLDMLERAVASLQAGQPLIIFPEGTRTPVGEAPRFHRGAAAIALRGATRVTPVTIRVRPTTLTKHEPWYRIPARRVHFSFVVGDDIDPQTFVALRPPPIASRRLNDTLHQHYRQELACDERSTHCPSA